MKEFFGLGLIVALIMSLGYIMGIPNPHYKEEIEKRAKAGYMQYAEDKGWKVGETPMLPWILLPTEKQEEWKIHVNYCGPGAAVKQ